MDNSDFKEGCPIKEYNTQLFGLNTYNLGKKLKRARMIQGLTQVELAQRCGTDESTIRKIENDPDYTPSLAFLDRYARALGVRIDIKVWFKNND